MTAVIDDLRDLTEAEIEPLLGSDDEAVRDAAIAEVDRRDAFRRRSRTARRAARERSQPAGWLEAAHGQSLELERLGGYVLSDYGKRQISGAVFPELWQIPEREIGRYLTEEAEQFFRGSPRITPDEYRRQIAASDHDEIETARAEARSTDSEEETMDTEVTGTPESIEQTYAAPAAVPPHEEPSSGAAILDEARAFISRFAILPSDAALDAVVLWAAHTHAFKAFNVTPRLALLSDEPASGKTRVLDLLGLLVARPEQVVDPTGPVVFVLIKESSPTLLLDETDMIFGRSGGSAKRQVLAVLNSGYKQGSTVPRARKDSVERFPVFAPVAFAGLGRLPDTLMTRSVVVRMRQRRKGEQCDAYMPRVHAPLGNAVGAALGSWTASVLPELASAWPTLPDGVQDRAAEIWEPLLSIAEVAGGSWPERARKACEALVLGGGGKPVRAPSLQLLDDIALVWPEGQAKMPTAELVRLLLDIPGTERQWDPASAPREVAAMLRPHSIFPVKIRQGERTMQGYQRSDFPSLQPQRAEAA